MKFKWLLQYLIRCNIRADKSALLIIKCLLASANTPFNNRTCLISFLPFDQMQIQTTNNLNECEQASNEFKLLGFNETPQRCILMESQR
jgi:hypothetical protein